MPLAGTLLALLLAGPGPLSGQGMGIQGRLLAGGTGDPIAGAAVQRHHSLLQLVSARPGLRILGAGAGNVVVTDRQGRPVSLCIDGLPFGDLTQDVWASPSQIIGVEVYAGVWQWERMQLATGRRTGMACSVLVWTGIPGSGGR